MKKRTSEAFGKKVFLLGTDKDGQGYWLGSPTWDCNWYWGFGYIETYTRNFMPHLAKDIKSHEHATNFMAEWFIGCNGSKPKLTDKTFTEAEGWELSELFKQFYHLREQSEFWGRGKMHVADTKIQNWTNKELANKINTEMIPIITARILEILTP